MSKPTDAEELALRQAGGLLRFAAENVEKLDEEISLAIAQATAAKATDAWTPSASQAFWLAYGRLCDLVRPVTVECLTAVSPVSVARRGFWAFLGPKQTSLAGRTSQRFLAALIALLLLVVPIQLYAWTLANLSKDIEAASQAIRESIRAHQMAEGKMTDPVLREDRAKADEAIRDLNRRLMADTASLSSHVQLLAKWRTLGLGSDDRRQAPASAQGYSPSYDADKVLREVKGEVTSANLVVAVLLSFVLPILFSTIGAVAYVIRTITSQIAATTFSPTSPIRHLLRVALGAMMGVVVGLFTELTQTFSLPQLAIAFLAGYGVEAVFSMFDGLVNRFKEPAK